MLRGTRNKRVLHFYDSTLLPATAVVTSLSYLYLSKTEGFFVIDWVETIGRDNFGSVLFPNGVRGKTVHVNFDICAYFFV